MGWGSGAAGSRRSNSVIVFFPSPSFWLFPCRPPPLLRTGFLQVEGWLPATPSGRTANIFLSICVRSAGQNPDAPWPDSGPSLNLALPWPWPQRQEERASVLSSQESASVPVNNGEAAGRVHGTPHLAVISLPAAGHRLLGAVRTAPDRPACGNGLSPRDGGPAPAKQSGPRTRAWRRRHRQ